MICQLWFLSALNTLQNDDKTGVSLHNGLWAPLFVIGAGTCMYVMYTKCNVYS